MNKRGTLLLRVLVLAVLVVVARSSALAQEYSTGIPADYDLIPNVTYLEFGAWQGKLALCAGRRIGSHPTVIFFTAAPCQNGSSSSRAATRASRSSSTIKGARQEPSRIRTANTCG